MYMRRGYDWEKGVEKCRLKNCALIKTLKFNDQGENFII